MRDYQKIYEQIRKDIENERKGYWRYYMEREKLERMAKKAWEEKGELNGITVTAQNWLVNDLYLKNAQYLRKEE